MPFIFDGATRTITEQALSGNPSIAVYDVLRNLWSEAERWWNTADNDKYAFPFRLSGGGLRFEDALGNPVYATSDIFLQNQSGQNWRIIPADYDHIIQFSGANLFAEDRSIPLYSLSNITSTVLFEITLSDNQTSYLINSSGGTVGGGLTTTQATQLTQVHNRTARVDALIENVNGDRFTSKSLEQAPASTGGGGTGATPQQIWEYTTRSLTDKSNFALSTSSIASIVSSVWSATTRTLTSAVSSFSVADIWNYATRSLTDKDGFAPTAEENAAAVSTELQDEFANITASVDLSPVLGAIETLPTLAEIQGILPPAPNNNGIGLILDKVNEIQVDDGKVLAAIDQTVDVDAGTIGAIADAVDVKLESRFVELGDDVAVTKDQATIAARNTQS